MKKTLSLTTLLLFLFVSCSSPEHQRTPSSIEAERPNLTSILEFKSSSGEAPIVTEKLDSNFLNSFGSELKTFRKVRSDVIIEMEKTDDLAEGVQCRIKFLMNDSTNQLRVVIESSDDIYTDPVVQLEVRSFLKKLFSIKYYNTVYDVFEAGLNAELGDINSYDNLLKIRTQNLEEIKSLGKIGDAFYESRHADLTQTREGVDELLNTQKRIIRDSEKERKGSLAALDRASELEQLRGLVASGKRAEAADLIRKYLPWEKMAPLERVFWEDNLKYMANPLPLEQRMLVFRGIDGDMTYPAVENGKFLAREVSEEEGKSFLMSSILTKNQGTWNRRLRSLETMNTKVITQSLTKSNEFTQNSRISTMMYQHSLNPAGSPFLSYTPRISTAQVFGKDKMVAFLLDPRIAYANFASAFEGEIEYLNTLVTFPDEMVALYDRSRDSNHTPGSFFAEKLRAKLSAVYGEAKGKKLAANFMDEAKEMGYKGTVHSIQSQSDFSLKSQKQGVLSKIYSSFKKIFSKAQDPLPSAAIEQAAQDQAPLGKVSKCTNIIELFFKKAVKVN